ncbi:cAMP-specific 3',5'-cAMP phosphodiesterase 4 [Pelomyxa schiedti]|nr:cAMP-specific 3',5'-cAMP phosphodiesterase 4 [Pelomyxa schiedti]
MSNYNGGLLFLLVCALGLPVASSVCFQDRYTPDGSRSVAIVGGYWMASDVNLALATILLQEKLGTAVTTTVVDNHEKWELLREGTGHIALEVWTSGEEQDKEAYIGSGQVINGGPLGVIGRNGWYIPTFCLERYPRADNFVGMSPSEREEFFTAVNHTLWSSPWATFDEQICRSNGWNLAVVPTDESVLLAKIDEAFELHQCIVFYLWDPHHYLLKHALSRVTLPYYTDSCYEHSSDVFCDYPEEVLYKALWPVFPTEFPHEFSLLKQLSLTNEDQMDIMYDVAERGFTYEEASCLWLQNHTATWATWIPARSNGGPSAEVLVPAIVCSVAALFGISLVGMALLIHQRRKLQKSNDALQRQLSVMIQMRGDIGFSSQAESVIQMLEELQGNSHLKANELRNLELIKHLIAEKKLYQFDEQQLMCVESEAKAFLLDQLVPKLEGSFCTPARTVTPSNSNFGVVKCGVKVTEHRINKWSFDLFEYTQTAEAHTLSTIACLLLRHHGLIEEFEIDEATFMAFAIVAEQNYVDTNPYHTSLHAADVMQAVHWLMCTELLCNIPPLEKLALLIAALAHDLCHPGVNNNFLVSSMDPLAIQYNDQSVLESMHAARLFQLLKQENLNFLKHLSIDQFRLFRKSVITLILSTDMAKHLEVIGEFNSILKVSHFDSGNSQHRLALERVVLKVADISNVSRPWKIASVWANKVVAELFGQGDKEKSLKMDVSPFMDRHNTNQAKMQSTFIQFVMMPLLDPLAGVMPEVSELISNAKMNISSWQQQLSSSPRTSPPATGHLRASGPQSTPSNGHLRASGPHSTATAATTTATTPLQNSGTTTNTPLRTSCTATNTPLRTSGATATPCAADRAS